MGRETRKRIPRTIHATLELPADRDPIAILTEQERDRLADLVPIRHSRMAESAFAYYRGAPAVMAADLATGAQTGFIVQASGDAHISNFGLFASPERTLVFDANDFDETLAGPWEWDVKRLAASVVIASRANGFTPAADPAGDADRDGNVPASDGRVRRDAVARHLVRQDHGRGHPRPVRGGRRPAPGRGGDPSRLEVARRHLRQGAPEGPAARHR